MNSRTTVLRWSVVVATVVLTGCASPEKQRMSMLEQTNDSLTGRLNGAHGELASTAQERDSLRSQLAMAMDDVAALRAQLDEAVAIEPAAPGWTAVPGGAMIAIEDGVLFRPGAVKVRPEARRTLDAVASTIQGQYDDKDILVIGHTDNQPIRKSGWEDNYQLSAERALAVVRYLRERGVDGARILAAGAGEYRPRVQNDSPSNRSANRRVEIFAIEPISRGSGF